MVSSWIDWIASKGRHPVVLPDWRWKARHSRWLWLTLPAGLTTWVGFLYIGLQAKRRSWIWLAVVYGIGAMALVALIAAAPTDESGETLPGTWQYVAGQIAMAIVWIGGSIHAFLVNVSWLKWRASTPPMPPPPPPPPVV